MGNNVLSCDITCDPGENLTKPCLHTLPGCTCWANTVQYVWEIGELMVRFFKELVPLRSSLKPSNTKSSPRLFPLLLSSPVIWAAFVQAALSLSSSLLSRTVLWTFSSPADHRVPTWIIWTWMKSHSRGTWSEMVSKAPLRALDEGTVDENLFTKPFRVLLYHLVAAASTFKGQTARDNEVFLSRCYSC